MEQASAEGEHIAARDLSAVKLADDVVLLTFQTLRPDRVSLGGAVWVRTRAELRLRFHQATVAAD